MSYASIEDYIYAYSNISVWSNAKDEQPQKPMNYLNLRKIGSAFLVSSIL